MPGKPKMAFGYGMAVNAFVPIIPARDARATASNALSVTGEVTIGTGIADLYTGLTGGALFPSLPNPRGHDRRRRIYRPNIDSGIVTFDADGNLQTIDWRALVVGLQYYLPVAGGRIWVSAQLLAAQVGEHRQPDPRDQPRRRLHWQEYFDANAYGRCTPAVQLGVSFQNTQQDFGDRPFGGRHPEDPQPPRRARLPFLLLGRRE